MGRDRTKGGSEGKQPGSLRVGNYSKPRVVKSERSELVRFPAIGTSFRFSFSGTAFRMFQRHASASSRPDESGTTGHQAYPGLREIPSNKNLPH